MTGRLVGAATMGPDARLAMAGLAHEALAPYYDLLSIPASALLAVLADEMRDPSTELGAARAILVDEQVAGLIVAYPAGEMHVRQQASLFHLLRSGAGESDVLLEAAAAQAADVPPIASEAYYLARIAVAETQRGCGLAAKLLSSIDEGLPPSIPVALHVHRDNERAIRFYRRHGYARSDDADLAFQTFVRQR
jgi:ribosomal protein S18 acetylase RimI-like enzyme